MTSFLTHPMTMLLLSIVIVCGAWEFAGRVPFFGQAILCLDDANIQRILPQLARNHRVLTYGLTPQADLAGIDLEARANVLRERTADDALDLGDITLGAQRHALPIDALG